MGDCYVRARVDEQVKEEAVKALAEMGLSVSDAIRMLMVRVAKEKRIPFEVRVPNETSQQTLEEADRKDLPEFDSIEALMDDLRA